MHWSEVMKSNVKSENADRSFDPLLLQICRQNLNFKSLLQKLNSKFVSRFVIGKQKIMREASKHGAFVLIDFCSRNVDIVLYIDMLWLQGSLLIF
jgi:hypothetical protein